MEDKVGVGVDGVVWMVKGWLRLVERGRVCKATMNGGTFEAAIQLVCRGWRHLQRKGHVAHSTLKSTCIQRARFS